MRMVVVRTVGTRFEAELLAAKLGAHGVLWEIRSRQLVPTTHPIGFLDVMVPAEELDDAEDVLTADEGALDDLDWPEPDDGDPWSDRPGDHGWAGGDGGGWDGDGGPLVPPRRLTPAMRTLRVLLGLGLAAAVATYLVGWLAGLFRFVGLT